MKYLFLAYQSFAVILVLISALSVQAAGFFKLVPDGWSPPTLVKDYRYDKDYEQLRILTVLSLDNPFGTEDRARVLPEDIDKIRKKLADTSPGDEVIFKFDKRGYIKDVKKADDVRAENAARKAANPKKDAKSPDDNSPSSYGNCAYVAGQSERDNMAMHPDGCENSTVRIRAVDCGGGKKMNALCMTKGSEQITANRCVDYMMDTLEEYKHPENLIPKESSKQEGSVQ